MSGLYEDEPDSLVGRILNEKYELLSCLGSGSMGAVYRARHLTLKKFVAVKVLHSDIERSTTGIARFEAEARAAGRFEHANSVSVIDFGRESDGLYFIVMEYIEGQDLRQLVFSEGVMTEQRACRLMSQVCAALAAAHDNGIVHRDMKPGNIMVTSRRNDQGEYEEFVKICDFGIAKLLPRADDSFGQEPMTLKGSFFGTPAYMSPEQARGEPSDARSDVYACGLILWMLLTGQRPFVGENAMSVAMKQISEPLPDISTYRSDISEGVRKIIQRATDKLPERRFSNGRAMYQMLLPYSSGKTEHINAAAMMENLLSSESLRTSADELNEVPGNVAIRPLLLPAMCLILGLVVAFFVFDATNDGDESSAISINESSAEIMGPPIPPKILITINGVPEGTEVFHLGQLVGVAPGQIQLLRNNEPALLVLRAEGHVSTSTAVVPQSSQTLLLTMKSKMKTVPSNKEKPKPKRPRRSRDRLEDPFEK
ncbi:MAG: serine/threonine-protein kinase [Myxococcota bacterium]|nr:serine/threonine-protein kinase [Myxococcota bacterium]